jgi:hypothetical protein
LCPSSFSSPWGRSSPFSPPPAASQAIQ